MVVDALCLLHLHHVPGNITSPFERATTTHFDMREVLVVRVCRAVMLAGM